MTRGRLWYLWVVAAFLIPTAATAQTDEVETHVLVEFSPGISTMAADPASEPVFGRWHRVAIPPGQSADRFLRALSSDPAVESATVDATVQLDPVGAQAVDLSAVASPNDPFFSYQWHFPPVQLEDAWARSSGADVVVAVVDTGIAREGEDLTCHEMRHPFDASSGATSLQAASDDNGHGTHVAGTIAQCTGNGVGVAGVAGDATLMPIKVLDAAGNGQISDIAAGVDWARRHDADIINLSLGAECSTTWPTCSYPILNDAIDAAVAEGIIVVAAAGNDERSFVSHPANHPDVVGVGAVDLELESTRYTNYGPGLDLVAPGGDTNADLNGDLFVDGVIQETFRASRGWSYYAFQGTSMATPHVTGAFALLRSAFPDAESSVLVSAVLESAQDLGPPGDDSRFGQGLVQMSDAIEQIRSGDDRAPTWPAGSRLEVVEGGDGTVRLEWPTALDEMGVVGYRVESGTEPRRNLDRTSRSLSLADVSDGDQNFAVRAYDTAGNLSGPLTATARVSDVSAPIWPVDARLSISHRGSGVQVSWPRPSDDSDVAFYRLSVDGQPVVETPDRAASVADLRPDTTYEVALRAGDDQGNLSEPLTATVHTSRYFLDIAGSAFIDEIAWMSANGLTRGCNPPDNSLFCPDESVTRGQMAAFLVRSLGLTPVDSAGFEDTTDSVFEADVTALANADIARGCNPPANSSFCPDRPVTRGEMAAFLVRAIRLTEGDISFDDTNGHIFEADIGRLAQAGITRGCNPPDNDRFCPDEPVTREQMAAFLARALMR